MNMGNFAIKVLRGWFLGLSILLICGHSLAQVGAFRQAAKELVEMVGTKLGREASKELMDNVGLEGVEVVLERAAKEGGEAAVQRVTKLGGNYGAKAIRALAESPALMSRALDDLPSGQIDDALGVIARQPKLMNDAIKNYGSNALKIEMTHRGVGLKLLTSLGDDVVNIYPHLTTDQAIQLSKYSSQLAQLPKPQLKQFYEQLIKAPAHVIETLNKSPNVLKAMAAVGILGPSGYKFAEGITQGDTEYNPDGSVKKDTGIFSGLTQGETTTNSDGTTTRSPLSIFFDSAGEGTKWAIILIGAAMAVIIILFGIKLLLHKR